MAQRKFKSAPVGADAPPVLSSYISGYAAATRNGRKSQRSARYALGQFCTRTGDPAPDELTHDDVMRWWESTEELAISSRRARLSVVRSFLNWLRARGELSGDPLAGIRTPKGGHAYPEVFTTEELAAIRGACRNSRERLVIELMASLGLRCMEVARLRVEDIDLSRQLVAVRGKGGSVETLPVPERVVRCLAAYLTEHPTASGPVVRDARSHAGGVSAQRMSDVAGEIIGRAVPRRRGDNRGAHALRRSLATNLLDSGANIRQVQAVLRHASLASTEHYLRRSNAEELRSLLDA
jgi:integrase/recombinase XerD